MIAGGGFAVMAWSLAQSRPGCCDQGGGLPVDRADTVGNSAFPTSCEYYRILDRATSHFKNMCGDPECFCARPRL